MVIQRLLGVKKHYAYVKSFRNKIYRVWVSKNLDINRIHRALNKNEHIECEIEFKSKKEPILRRWYIKKPKHPLTAAEEAEILEAQKQEYEQLGGDY